MLSRNRKPQRNDYSVEAEQLFLHFAQAYELEHRPIKAPVEMLWEFPIQSRLHIPITVGLQNGDELNFGIPGFWSYFFPFSSVCTQFESLLHAWIAGTARIVNRGKLKARRLEVLEYGNWKNIYSAWPGGTWPYSSSIVRNEPCFLRIQMKR